MVTKNEVFLKKISRAQLHQEWDAEPPKNPGKILLLYSPDSKVRGQFFFSKHLFF